MSVHLILGGARSGKSRYAESLVLAKTNHVNCHYVATAQAFDPEMQARILHHQQRRGEQWSEHECPLALAPLINRFTDSDMVLVDCLTLWMNNLIYDLGEGACDDAIQSEVTKLVDALVESPARIVLVSNEVGLGVVPLGEVTRLFVDHAGWMNQAIAAKADEVTFIAAGLPMKLKG
ncbi:adenosylcobinamide kinase/adenosylcobinamide-phosphate guanylyltransferase [Vibrio sinaloensis DSM 21326]|uniref:Bifunctional adenosylcobalamin biosynthesis protein n=1 Tax=Vibrio sinaloensis DSM 21326 TaxID=945550 RepID=E8M624_PHOS4|nr:bifunctional adenosylcobinamide kinase/adenosylcobinamide-phosphate guanylyltransferase [Vibrio sinaloensis]EGA70474.1 adenosylcobinamide kinase/adenosylcobinamide-phosphate guanylyltransferase [Vibrio sinaloensis DSM 21326]